MCAARRDFRVVVVIIINNNNDHNNNNCNSIWDSQHIYNDNIRTDNIRESKEPVMVAKNYLPHNECFYAYFIYSYNKLKR